MDKSLEGSILPERVRKYCDANKLIARGDSIVVGVSGGADSMCLLFVLYSMQKEYELNLQVVHINHCIRGESADQDENYVKQICGEYNIPFLAIKRDAIQYANQKGCSVEEAGREIRYQAFQEVCEQKNANKIAVAHNMDDQAETVLFRMFRGTGLKGLKAMEPIAGNIIRPLLSTTRNEIEAYLKSANISFQTDETNLSEQYARNRIRRSILPIAEETINQGAVLHLSELAKQCMEASDFIEQTIKEAYNNIVTVKNNILEINIEELQKLHPYIQSELVLYSITTMAGRKRDITKRHVDAVLGLVSNQVSRKINLPYGLIARKSYGIIKIEACKTVDQDKNDATDLSIPGSYTIASLNMKLELRLQEYHKTDIIPKNHCTKWFDYDKIRDTIQIRNRREGDYLRISQGTRSLKKYFIDNKIPAEERNSIPLLADGQHILWVFGHRATEGCNVDEHTTRVLAAELKPIEK